MFLDRLLGNTLVQDRYQKLLTLGSTLGVLSIVLVLALFANYYRAVERLLLGIQPHLALVKESGFSEGDLTLIEEWLAERGDEVQASSFSVDVVVNATVEAVAPHSVVCDDARGPGACFDFEAGDSVETKPRQAVGYELERSRSSRLRIRGVVAENNRMVTDIPRLMDVRGVDLDRMASGPENGLPWSCLFDRNLFPGATPLDDFLVSLTGNEADQGLGDDQPFRLLSTLNLGMRKGEHPLFVTSPAAAQALLGRPGFLNALEIRLRDPYAAAELAQGFRERVPDAGIDARSWTEKEAGAFRLLKVLRTVIFVVIFSLMVVAGLAIVSTLSLVVVENRSTIAMLRALGLRDRSLFRALIFKCWRIAAGSLVVGTLLGHLAVAGLLFVPTFREGLAKMGIIDPSIFVEGADLGLLVFATFILYLVVAVVPARDACRIDVVEGLQS